MSSKKSGGPDTCKFGHVFTLYNESERGLSPDAKTALNEIRKGQLTSYSDLEDRGISIGDLFGSPVRKLKGKGGGQGTAYGTIVSAPDKYEDDLGYVSKRITESIFISPQSPLHDEFIQRKQQAEQRVNQTLANFSDILETKHLLEHDIRKLRSRTEAFNSQDETVLKGDFVQLVDGAGAGGQGADEQALRFLRDNNIYPTIVSDFMEMNSVNDLKKAEDREDDEDGFLADLPRNEKAILRKKYVMYEKWKDLYGSEVNRRLKELKSQLQNIERSIENTKNWLNPYVRDVVMINELGDNQTHMTNYYQWKGYAAMIRQLEFLCYKPMVKKQGKLYPASGEEPTHYRVMFITGFHVVMANSEQPNQPGGGNTGVVGWYPAVVCKHVFENFFQPRLDKAENLVDEMMDDYVGEFSAGKGQKYRLKREEKDMSVRDLREKVEQELDEHVPIEFSSKIRRIEDGLDDPNSVTADYSSKHFEALNNILGIEAEDSENNPDMYTGLDKKLKLFTGKTDKYKISEGDAMNDMISEFRFEYYFDFKISLGMHTMK